MFSLFGEFLIIVSFEKNKKPRETVVWWWNRQIKRDLC